MYDTNAVNAVTRAMRSEVSDHVTASEKNSLRELLEKLVKMLGFCQNGIFGQKFDFSNSA